MTNVFGSVWASEEIGVTDGHTIKNLIAGIWGEEGQRTTPFTVNDISFLNQPGKHPAFSHTRATVGALCQQFDGSFYQPEIGEIGSHGMRRVRNLLSNTTAAWTGLGAAITAVTVAGPDGVNVTAHAITEDTANSYHYAKQDVLTTGDDCFVQAIVKPFGSDRDLRIEGTGGTLFAGFDLSAGTLSSGTGGIEAVGNGWFRVWGKKLSTIGAMVAIVVRTPTEGSYIGDGASGVYLLDYQATKARPGQMIPDPEYVSRGALSAPYHGWGIDGVRCFATDEYGNDLTIGLGPELLSNGSFADGGTGWSTTSAGANTITFADGVVTIEAPDALSAAYIRQFVTPIGKTFLVEGDITIRAGSMSMRAGLNSTLKNVTASGHFSETLVNNGNTDTQILFSRNGVSDFDLDNISVREVYPVLAAGAVRNPAVTNLFAYANPSAGSPWISTQGGNVSAGGAIAGLPNSLAIVDNSALSYAYRSLTLSGDVVIQAVVRMDDLGVPVPGTTQAAGVDMLLVVEGIGNNSTPQVDSLGGGLYRIWRTVAATGVAGNYGFLKYTGNSTRGFKVLLFQVHAGTEPLPFVLTDGASVAVSADAMSLDPTAWGYDQDGGVWAVKFTPFLDRGTSADNQHVMRLKNSAASRIVLSNRLGNFGLTVQDGTGTTVGQSEAAEWTVGEPTIAAFRVEQDDASAVANGNLLGAVDNEVTPPPIDTILIGGEASGSFADFAGAIEAVYYFPPGTVTDAQLLAMSNGDLPTIPELS